MKKSIDWNRRAPATTMSNDELRAFFDSRVRAFQAGLDRVPSSTEYDGPRDPVLNQPVKFTIQATVGRNDPWAGEYTTIDNKSQLHTLEQMGFRRTL